MSLTSLHLRLQNIENTLNAGGSPSGSSAMSDNVQAVDQASSVDISSIVSPLETKISLLEDKITSLEASLLALNNSFADVAPKADLERMNVHVEKFNNKVDSLIKKVSALEQPK
jgi:exonuclease VII small subunit